MALVESLRAAASPRELDPSRHTQILARALAPRQGKVRSLAFGGIASLAALAAAFALFMGQRSRSLPTALESQAQLAEGPAVAVSRSTTALFPDGIPATGGTSERVDRIAFARAQDLRENRFARWGFDELAPSESHRAGGTPLGRRDPLARAGGVRQNASV